MAEISPLTQEELAALQQCEARPEVWDSVVVQIRAARYGAYPPDWYEKVLATGLLDRITGGLQMHTFDDVHDAIAFLHGDAQEAPDAD